MAGSTVAGSSPVGACAWYAGTGSLVEDSDCDAANCGIATNAAPRLTSAAALKILPSFLISRSPHEIAGPFHSTANASGIPPSCRIRHDGFHPRKGVFIDWLTEFR